MTLTSDSAPAASSMRTEKLPILPLIFIGGLFFVELVLIGTVFKHQIDFDCIGNWPTSFCKRANSVLIVSYCLFAVLVMLAMVRPVSLKELARNAGERVWPLIVNGAGVIISFAPLAFLNGAQGQATFIPSVVLWGIGLTLILSGAALYIAPVSRWRAYFVAEWHALVPATVLALFAPSLSLRLQPIWSIDWITDRSFEAVTGLMTLFGYDLYTDPDQKIIGAGDFFVRVANACSGIEGIALVTIFVTLYLWLFRNDLRFPLALLLFPIGIMTSVIFNIVRISVLLSIGLAGNPDLAVGGFHSHAGWMMFTIVALGVIALAQTVPALRKTTNGRLPSSHSSSVPPFLQDPIVAQILPFAVFMLSALVASTFSQTPSAIYPVRVVLMIGVLLLVLPFYRRLPWRIDPVAVVVGAFIAAYWVLIPVEPSEDPVPYGQLTGIALVLWFVARGFGTTVLIPIIEEAFFRGYLEKRLRFGAGLTWVIISGLVSAVLFAALHGRWAEAFVAGLLFSWVAWRRGNLTDAIVCHGVANGLIFAAAVISGNIAMI